MLGPALAIETVPTTIVQDRILEVGAELFAEHGYEAVSLRHICEAAQVSKGAIYHHFSSKEDLLSAIVISSLEQLLDEVERHMATEQTAGDRLRGFIVSQARFFEAHTAGFRVAMSRFASLGDTAAQDRIDTLRRAYIRTVRLIFAGGVATGEFRTVDVRAATRMVLSLLYWLARWHEAGSRTGAVAIAQAHADLMLRGVEAK